MSKPAAGAPVQAGDVDYVIRTDGEGFEVPSGETYLLACCDCGLVHEIVLVSHDDLPIGMAARVNTADTRARRSELGIGAGAQRKIGNREIKDILAQPRVADLLTLPHADGNHFLNALADINPHILEAVVNSVWYASLAVVPSEELRLKIATQMSLDACEELTDASSATVQ